MIDLENLHLEQRVTLTGVIKEISMLQSRFPDDWLALPEGTVDVTVRIVLAEQEVGL